jgi:hypothetical protein
MDNKQDYVDLAEEEAMFLRAFQTFIKDIFASLDSANTISDGYFIFNKIYTKFWKCKYIYYDSTGIAKVFDPQIMINIKFFNGNKYTASIKEDYVYKLKTTSGFESEAYLEQISSKREFYEEERTKKAIFLENSMK